MLPGPAGCRHGPGPIAIRSVRNREIGVQFLLRVSQGIDWLNESLGRVANILVLLSCVVSAGNAMVRYAYDYSSNGWLEVQWYMFAVMVMFGASYTFKRNEHVRVEIFYLYLNDRGQHWLDLIGAVVFLIPVCTLLAYLSWPFFMQAYAVNEWSGNAGGLVRWPIKLVLPLGFGLLALQGVSEVVKRAGALLGYRVVGAKYERPTQ
jgi:TRAP-type mannitol/chloroaromatic compound transport system permease small subunit